MSTAPNPLRELGRLGQSVWLDDIGRTLLDEGTLERMIREDGVAGVTSNPAILAASIMHEPPYTEAVSALLPRVQGAPALYEALAIADLRRAADLFRPVHAATGGLDGRVSLEVSPHLADDTDATVREAQRLYRALDRDNALIKIPATRAGLAAIRATLARGIGVNVTLLFSPERYAEVLGAWAEGLELRLSAGETLEGVDSVASFFVSRIDTLVDKRLDALAAGGQPAARALRGKAAVASACRAWEVFEDFMGGERWSRLAAAGARPQRLLWASTSTKDPSYSPIKYVEELVAPGTVNTMPRETLEAYRRQGRPELRLERHIAEAADVREQLERLGVDMEEVAATLEREGVTKFVEPFDQLQQWLEARI